MHHAAGVLPCSSTTGSAAGTSGWNARNAAAGDNSPPTRQPELLHSSLACLRMSSRVAAPAASRTCSNTRLRMACAASQRPAGWMQQVLPCFSSCLALLKQLPCRAQARRNAGNSKAQPREQGGRCADAGRCARRSSSSFNQLVCGSMHPPLNAPPSPGASPHRHQLRAADTQHSVPPSSCKHTWPPQPEQTGKQSK